MALRPIQIGERLGTEQRRHKRVSLTVSLQCGARGETIQATAENISRNGLLIRAAKTFGEDEEITLSFSLPGSTKSIQCQARVAHVVPDLFMGIEFLGLASEAAQQVEEFVAAQFSKSETR
ncbi:MAG: PilZ domain-containing protein [Acidobacteria bacterium]|nr:PilZ domain-containing protein [Acidobacteriota bacterium]